MSQEWNTISRTSDLSVLVFVLTGVKAGKSIYRIKHKHTGETRTVSVSFSEDKDEELRRVGEKISDGDFDD